MISEAIVHHYGRDELLRRLAHPFWFQSFGAVMGMDWHSSGITTSVIGALKRGLAPLSGELGLHVCGGRGQAFAEDAGTSSRRSASASASMARRWRRTSRLVAKVDSAAVQDGFDLYLHGFIVADDGKWVVVQQGMNGDRRQARRYHWLSEGLASFVDAPHAAIEGQAQGEIVNLTDARAGGLAARAARSAARARAGWCRCASWRLWNDRRRRPGPAHACRIWRCPTITTSGRKTSSRAGCTARWRRRPSRGRSTSPTCC